MRRRRGCGGSQLYKCHRTADMLPPSHGEMTSSWTQPVLQACVTLDSWTQRYIRNFREITRWTRSSRRLCCHSKRMRRQWGGDSCIGAVALLLRYRSIDSARLISPKAWRRRCCMPEAWRCCCMLFGASAVLRCCCTIDRSCIGAVALLLKASVPIASIDAH
jgi:hypothetical protein